MWSYSVKIKLKVKHQKYENTIANVIDKICLIKLEHIRQTIVLSVKSLKLLKDNTVTLKC